MAVASGRVHLGSGLQGSEPYSAPPPCVEADSQKQVIQPQGQESIWQLHTHSFQHCF